MKQLLTIFIVIVGGSNLDAFFTVGLIFTSGAAFGLLKIIAIDIVLSGDNAVVIAMATKALTKKQQNKAILLGIIGAVVLRIFFAAIIIYLLQVPFVHVIGGLLLLWISYNLLVEGEEEKRVTSHPSLFRAVLTIIIADAIMSLDNVVAITGAAHGDIRMVIFGVMISIPIMLFGSKLIVNIIEKHHWIAYIGSGILAWTAGEMILTDQKLTEFLKLTYTYYNYILVALLTLTILLTGYINQKK